MRTAGIIILLLGLFMTAYTGFTFVTKEKVVDIGTLEITRDHRHRINWQPYAGIGAVVIGAVFIVMSRKQALTN